MLWSRKRQAFQIFSQGFFPFILRNEHKAIAHVIQFQLSFWYKTQFIYKGVITSSNFSTNKIRIYEHCFLIWVWSLWLRYKTYTPIWLIHCWCKNPHFWWKLFYFLHLVVSKIWSQKVQKVHTQQIFKSTQ